ncbi:hypothetical protein [Mesorhizobium carmichaelinearum]|uniref:hypothetical protein n=1 Tax=Mesorhizobium carmichaelinearum TaxID=1208188 RepID=UPI00117F90EA|nr:hypothetical protein [Mesorhizobium carmichaelinearum]
MTEAERTQTALNVANKKWVPSFDNGRAWRTGAGFVLTSRPPIEEEMMRMAPEGVCVRFTRWPMPVGSTIKVIPAPSRSLIGPEAVRDALVSQTKTTRRRSVRGAEDSGLARKASAHSFNLISLEAAERIRSVHFGMVPRQGSLESIVNGDGEPRSGNRGWSTTRDAVLPGASWHRPIASM